MSTPKVSIIVPIYNLETYIELSVRSLLAQSYQNIEIILVDDGSKDNSLSLIKQLAAEDSRIVYTSQPNGGAAKARNTGLAMATGEYITFVDGDDMLSSNAISDNIGYFDNGDIDWVAFTIRNANQDGSFTLEKGAGFLVKETECIEAKDFVPYFYKHKLSGVACGAIFRRSSIHNIRFKDGLLYEDSLFFVELICNTKNAILSTKGMYLYVDRPSSSNKSSLTYKHIESKYNIATYRTSIFRTLFPEYEDYYTRSEYLYYYFFKREAAKGTDGAAYFYKSFKKEMKSRPNINLREEIKCLAYKCKIHKLLK